MQTFCYVPSSKVTCFELVNILLVKMWIISFLEVNIIHLFLFLFATLFVVTLSDLKNEEEEIWFICFFKTFFIVSLNKCECFSGHFLCFVFVFCLKIKFVLIYSCIFHLFFLSIFLLLFLIHESEGNNELSVIVFFFRTNNKFLSRSKHFYTIKEIKSHWLLFFIPSFTILTIQLCFPLQIHAHIHLHGFQFTNTRTHTDKESLARA